jgi:hypothetical protein
VKQEQVLAFQSVLGDIPGQPRGIMVARSGFQEGARRYAAHHGIELYELREPRESDWEGLICAVQITSQLLCPSYRKVAFEWDQAWVRARLQEHGLRTLALKYTIYPHRNRIEFESGTACDLPRVLAPHVPPEACDWTPIRHEFHEAVMVEVPECPIPFLRALAVAAEVRVTETVEEFEVAVDHLVAYCFRDVLSGDVRWLGADGGPIGPKDDDGA